MANPIGVVVNPSSGKGKGKQAGHAVFQTLQSLGFKTVDLSADSYAQALANAKAAVAAGNIQALMVVGGDGMAHLGVNACALSNIPLAIIPAGTGNDSAATLGMPADSVGEAVKMAVAHLAQPRRVDLIRGTTATSTNTPQADNLAAAGNVANAGNSVTVGNEFYSFGSVSAGFDALVNARANKMRFPKGPSRYQVAMVLELFKFRGISYTTQMDGQVRQFDAMLCAVANAPRFGGGMLFAPHSKVDNGFLELFIVHKIARTTLLRIFPKVFTGKHVSHPSVEFVTFSKATIDSHGLPIYADGEYVGQSPIAISVVPGGLLTCSAAVN